MENLTNFVTGIADKIRKLKNTTDVIPAMNFETELDNIAIYTANETITKQGEVINVPEGYHRPRTITSNITNLKAENVPLGKTIGGVVGTWSAGYNVTITTSGGRGSDIISKWGACNKNGELIVAWLYKSSSDSHYQDVKFTLPSGCSLMGRNPVADESGWYSLDTYGGGQYFVIGGITKDVTVNLKLEYDDWYNCAQSWFLYVTVKYV